MYRNLADKLGRATLIGALAIAALVAGLTYLTVGG